LWFGDAPKRRSLCCWLWQVFVSGPKKAMRLRMLGSAALGLTYVASGALDAFLLPRFELWDVAAGRLLVEVSGGSYWQEGPNSVLIAARNEALLEDLKQIWYGVNS